MLVNYCSFIERWPSLKVLEPCYSVVLSRFYKQIKPNSGVETLRVKAFIQAVVAILLLNTVAFSSLRADVLPSFYDISVPVESTDPEELKEAAQLAMQNMLIRASGTEGVLQNRRLQQAFADANNYISQYGYQRADSGEFFVAFNFSADVVEKLLSQAGAPVWTPDRPSTLVWLAVEEAGEQRVAVAGDEVFDALVSAAADRGLVLKSPLYDLQDRFTLSGQQLWLQDREAVNTASERYSANVIMMARAWQDSRKAWHINWDMLNTRGLNAGSESCLRLTDCFNVPVAELAEKWAAQYGVVTKFSETQALAIEVGGLDFDAYSQLIAYLKDLPATQKVVLTGIVKGRYHFDLEWQAEQTTLRDLLALNQSLQALGSTQVGLLKYHWVN